ncbi:MAG: type II secretion system protein [Verrucomicrobiales bacterium]
MTTQPVSSPKSCDALSASRSSKKSSKKKPQRKAFTLIELLVVITIIGILVSIAVPVFSNVQRSANFTAALAEARGIGLAMMQYAQDANGSFVRYERKADGSLDTGKEVATANAAFGELIKEGIISREKPFGITGDPWLGGIGPDDNIEPISEILKKGENSYAYVLGLTSTSNGAFPLIANAFVPGSQANPVYIANTASPGGVFAGQDAVVIRVDGSASKERVNRTSLQVDRPGTSKNMFATDPNWLPAGTAKVLLPIP